MFGQAQGIRWTTTVRWLSLGRYGGHNPIEGLGALIRFLEAPEASICPAITSLLSITRKMISSGAASICSWHQLYSWVFIDNHRFVIPWL